ncbi:ribokinase [Psychromonas sp. MB-3u-54]|uniref:ribokinase n=1 Tax=Psychromonas sp. MB-3u-54 TaxID=2058319 RepID=UPI000C3456E4|nr:ribokinase [Psychromonas sp. MB-3u-54]PKH01618.1 ribokinase [Psychromonas sp. MB-3u-54]
MNKLVVLGSVNADHVLQVPSFPRPGETLYGKGYAVIPGGKGANQAVAAARLGADVAFIACVGDDSFGVNIRDAFKSDGINVDGVMIEKKTPTGIAMIQVSASGENSICISAEANNHLTPERISPFSSLISAAEMLLMQLETPIETIQAAAETAKLSATVVVLNPAPAQSLSDDLLKLVDIITPNETEAEQLTGIKVKDMPSAQQAAEKLHHKGIETVMITLGREGVWLSRAGTGKQIKGFAVKAVDTTAAGDTFNGALLTRLLEKASVEEAIRFAHAAAAITVTGKGAQTSIPNRQAVEQFLQQMDKNNNIRM